MSVWTGKPCQRCRGAKGPKHASLKFCFRCAQVRRREVAERAHHTRVARVYGIEYGHYEVLYRLQGRVCAICNVANGRTRRLCVDHDHATGAVRGLLCRPCNRMLGMAHDQAAFFERAANYLRHPPAAPIIEVLPQ